MLQAGSYKNKSDADRLKAELALKGQVSSIQKVSIQGKGDFYRVRLGPYLSYEEMAKADQSLLDQGLKTLRLKISKGG
jgi:cell division protein FtsN